MKKSFINFTRAPAIVETLGGRYIEYQRPPVLFFFKVVFRKLFFNGERKKKKVLKNELKFPNLFSNIKEESPLVKSALFEEKSLGGASEGSDTLSGWSAEERRPLLECLLSLSSLLFFPFSLLLRSMLSNSFPTNAMYTITIKHRLLICTL